MIENAKFSGYYFYLNLNIWADFQICISVPLSLKVQSCKLCNNKYTIASTQITNTEIFAFTVIQLLHKKHHRK